MERPQLSKIVSLACHDLRTPLATVTGFAMTLSRSDSLDERSTHFASMIETAAGEIATLLDELGALARIERHIFEPTLAEADTLELASTSDERIAAIGRGETIETDGVAVARSLAALATAAVRYGALERVTWTVDGRTLTLAPITADAGPVVVAADTRDFGSIVACCVIDALGGSVELDGEMLLVRL